MKITEPGGASMTTTESAGAVSTKCSERLGASLFEDETI